MSELNSDKLEKTMGKPVTVMLDKERHLQLTLGGMKKFREATGFDLLKNDKKLENFSEDDMIAFFWACLLPEDRELTLEDVGYMLTPSKIKELSEMLIKTWGLPRIAKWRE